MSAAAPRLVKQVRFQLPRKLGFLMEMHPYKVAWGGRNSLKSWSFADALLTLGTQQDLRILCARETQKSLTESVHQLLRDRIQALGYSDRYTITENAIRGVGRDTLFRFSGLSNQTILSIKSFEGFDIAWIEEASNVKKRSWEILLPTIFRTKNSEVWISFNPDMDSDETWERFIVNPPEGAVVREMNWRDAVACGWLSNEQERLRQRDLAHSKDYDNIWEGKPRTVVIGAIYATEVIEMIREKRFRPVPYDPRLPVHRIWDLGWNDLMTVIMVQKPHPSALNVINYLEDSHVTYPQMLATMDPLRYRWGLDWLPHDGAQHDPKSGTSAFKMLAGLGCRLGYVHGRPGIPKSDPEARIKAGRAMFPRIYMDNTRRETPPEFPDRQLGAAFLMDRLKRYKRTVGQLKPGEDKPEARGPEHDAASHAADAWGGLAEIADRIRNEGDDDARPNLPAYRNADPGMGMLG